MAAKTAAGLIFSLCLGTAALAATPPPPSSGAAIAVTPQPSWNSLSVAQRTALAPLGNEWNQLDNVQRRKWLLVAERYWRMSAAEQERLQDNMRAWAMLTPQQRLAARDKYREVNQMTPEERASLKQKWQEYQVQREEEQRRNLAPPAADRNEASTQ